MAIGARLRGILDELFSSADSTDELINELYYDRGYPESVAERIAYGELDMRPGAIAERRQDFAPNMETFYHGGAPNIGDFGGKNERGFNRDPAFVSNSPMIANTYVTQPGAGTSSRQGQIYPLAVDTRDFMYTSARGQNWEDMRGLNVYDPNQNFYVVKDGTPFYSKRDRSFDTDQLAELALGEEAPGIIIDDVVDIGPNFRAAKKAYRGNKDLYQDFLNLERGNKVMAVNDPSRIRSLLGAAFDPEYKGSNILGERAIPVAGAGLLAAAAMSPEEAEAGPLSAAARAAQQGFTNKQYHASMQDFDRIVPGYEDGLFFTSPNPEFASNWAGKGKLQNREGELDSYDRYRPQKEKLYKEMGSPEFGTPEYDEFVKRSSEIYLQEQNAFKTVYPLLARTEKTFDPEKNFDDIADLFDEGRLNAPFSSEYPTYADALKGGSYILYENPEVVRHLKSKGYDSMFLRESTGSKEAREAPYTTVAHFYPDRNIRSQFAEFAEGYTGPNILGGTAAGALGLTALMAPEEAEAKTPEFLASLPQLEPYEPGMVETAVQNVADFLKGIGATESDYTANQMASSLSNLADFTPVVGDAKGFAEARDAFSQGNYGEAALLGGLGLLGLIPLGGDIAAAALKGALPLGAMRARQGDPERLIELGYLTPDSATNPSAVKSAITKYEKNLKQSRGFAFRENLAAQNDAVTARQLDQFEPSIVTPEQISQGNYVLMPVMGDPSAIGLVDMVGGVPLADQVAIEGGVDFAQKFGTGPEGVAWASNLGAAKPQFQKYRDIANLTGRRPLVAYAKMLDDSSNFATGPAEIMMQQMPSLKIAKADKKKFDDELRSQYEDWPGLDSPEAMDWVMGRGDFPNIGKRRTAFTTIMAKSDYRDRGFPVYNEAIEAVLKPELIGDERYQSGFSLFTPDLDRDIFPFEGHKSYDTAMPGQFFGNLEQTVPMEVMYPRAVSKNMQRMTSPKDPIKNPPRLFSLDEAKNAVITGTDKYSPVFEIPDQYWLDGLLSAMGR